ncbi:MAG: glycosyl transferase [Acidobacteria bacterium]|nr:glycosyl transferase [Acidobacteriota bacterium]
MADFYQHRLFTTLHRLERLNLEELEASLERAASRRRMALLLPSLASEMDGPALPGIIENLRHVRYLHRVVVALDRATAEDYRRALEFFSVLPQEVNILWLDGPSALEIFGRLEQAGLVRREGGKGQAVWFALGFLLGIGDCNAVALHDCDVVTYDRYLLARLCFPVLRLDVDFKYAKAYYARISDRLNGRVTRLFMYPILTALAEFFPGQPFLEFLGAFRYPLSGEMAMHLDVARHIRVPSDWGLEVGLLAEVYRNLSTKEICQVDIAGRYDHKHQALSTEDPEQGLMRMVKDITGTILRTLAGEGARISPSLVASLQAAYTRTAQDYIERYAQDSAINGYPYDRDLEERTVEAFALAIQMAGDHYLQNLLHVPLLPNWNRVESALPDIPEAMAILPYKDRRGLE